MSLVSENLSGSYHFEIADDKDERSSLLVSTSYISDMSKSQIFKNVFIKSIGFLFLFAPFHALCNLQSTLHVENGVGVGGLAVIYGSVIFSCMFLPTFVIAHLGYKWTIVLSMMCYVLYFASNFEPIWIFMGPAAGLLGIGAGPLWSAQSTFLTQLAIGYSQLTGTNINHAIYHFFGIFYGFYQTSQVFGNLMASGVLSKKEVIAASSRPFDKCGVEFEMHIITNNTNFDRPDEGKLRALYGIYIFLALIAYILVATCLSSIRIERKDEDLQIRRSSVRLLLSTFQHWTKHPNQLLLVLPTIYSGIERGFITSVYTTAFISCALGLTYIGYIMVCYGLVDAICSYVFSRLTSCIPVPCFFIIAFLVHLITYILLLLWKIQPEQEFLFYVFGALLGIGDAVIKTQTNALYACLYPKNLEAAFANYRLLESIGFLLMFTLTDVLSTRFEILFALVMLILGIISYTILELTRRLNENR